LSEGCRSSYTHPASPAFRTNPDTHCGCDKSRSCSKPVLTRMITTSPKSGTHLMRAFRLVMCELLPGECIWSSNGLPDVSSPGKESAFQSFVGGPILPGVPFRLLVATRDPFTWLVSSYSYFGLHAKEYGMCRDTAKGRCPQGAKDEVIKKSGRS
jgi:hypothetical protein